MATEEALQEVVVFANNTEGYVHLYPAAIALSKENTLLAFVEGKKNEEPPRYLVVRRSTDNGKTWGPLDVVAEGDETLAIGNVCPVVDRQTGTIWLAFCGRGADRLEDRVFVTHSTDDGKTWAERVEITSDVKSPEWGYYYTGPGHGIQLESGRLLFPCHHSGRNSTQKDFKEFARRAGSHVLYSDDHGETWNLGGASDRFMDECQVVERADGSLLLSMRNYLGDFELGKPLSGSQQRAFATSTDSGLSWSESILNPQVYCTACMTSIHRYSLQPDAKNRIVYAGPGGPGRTNTTVRLSYDEGKTWPVARMIHKGSVGGSDLTVMPDGTIGLLYSHGPAGWDQTSFVRFTLEWLTEGKDEPST
jgi:sialidase-1